MTLAMTGRAVGKQTQQRHHPGDDFEALTLFLAWSVNEDTVSFPAADFSSAMR